MINNLYVLMQECHVNKTLQESDGYGQGRNLKFISGVFSPFFPFLSFPFLSSSLFFLYLVFLRSS